MPHIEQNQAEIFWLLSPNFVRFHHTT